LRIGETLPEFGRMSTNDHDGRNERVSIKAKICPKSREAGAAAQRSIFSILVMPSQGVMSTMSSQRTVYILDDDWAARHSLELMLESDGLHYASYESGEEFLEEARPGGPSILILDMMLPGLSGLDVLERTRTRPGLAMPVIAVTAAASVVTAVRSMKLGAYDFLIKPVDRGLLLERVREALAADADRRQRELGKAASRSRVAELTEREREVLGLLCTGKSNKQMAMMLNISIRTVAIHRWHLMKKMQATSAAEAVRIALHADAA